jgi:hypothetical protein
MVPIVQLMPQYVDLEHVNPCPRRLESLVVPIPLHSKESLPLLGSEEPQGELQQVSSGA